MVELTCRTCCKEKPSEDFYKNSNTKRGFCLDCKECSLARRRLYYQNNFDKIQAYHQKRYRENKELINQRNNESYQKNIEKRRLHHKIKREEWNERLHSYFGGGCQVCGYNEPCYAVYECHHLDPEVKDYCISQLSCKDWETEVLPELKKCIYLCIICHRKLHAGRFDVLIKSGELVISPRGK